MNAESNKIGLNTALEAGWLAAAGGAGDAQAGWEVIDGGDWSWNSRGVSVTGTGPEWVAIWWRGWDAASARNLKNFAIELTISGSAEAAGLSFGGFKDFLASLDQHTGPRHLLLEVDVDSGCWAFRVDGELMRRCWWDAAVCSVDDILDGCLRLKVRHAREVLFQNLTIHCLEASCRISVIITCHRFLQRLRLCLRNWCHQDVATGAIEVLIVNPQSPDGTHEYLATVTRSYPHVRLREIQVGPELVKNKGAMINRALEASRGPWVWLTDADCLYGPNSASSVLDYLRNAPDYLFYGERRFLDTTQTDSLLSGRADALRQFADLAAAAAAVREPERYPWGYTQIVRRSTIERLRYPEDQNHFAHSDGMFTEACKRNGVMPELIDGLFCLHLDHPFAWYGTDRFL